MDGLSLRNMYFYIIFNFSILALHSSLLEEILERSDHWGGRGGRQPINCFPSREKLFLLNLTKSVPLPRQPRCILYKLFYFSKQL